MARAFFSKSPFASASQDCCPKDRVFGSSIALLYLAVPVLLFLAGFIRPTIAAFCGCLIVLAWGIHALDEKHLKTAPKEIIAAVLFSVFVMWVTGFPDGPFTLDWYKHWAIFNTLVSSHWPPLVRMGIDFEYLRYYLGIYLVPAGLSKIIPFVKPATFFALWLFLGCFLVFWLLSAFSPRRRLGGAVIALFLTIGGAGVFAAHGFRAVKGLKDGPWMGLHYDVWAVNTPFVPYGELSSMLTSLIWVPHQSIATFLVSAMIYAAFKETSGKEILRKPKSFNAALLGYGLLAIWSPYGMIGLAPLMALLAWTYRAAVSNPQTLLCGIAGVAFSALAAKYLSAGLNGINSCLFCLPDTIDTPGAGFVVFWIVQFIGFGLILRHRLFCETPCLVALLTVMAITVAHGSSLDFMMRGTMGPLFLLTLRSAIAVVAWTDKRRFKILQVAAIALSLPLPLSEVFYVKQEGTAYAHFSPGDPQNVGWQKAFAARADYSIADLFAVAGWDISNQYFSREKPFASRDPERVADAPKLRPATGGFRMRRK